MRSSVWNKAITKGGFSISSQLLFPFLTMMIVLLLGGVIGTSTPYIWGAVVGAIILILSIVLRQDEMTAALVIAFHLYFDWFLGLRVVGLVIVLILLLIFFLARSLRYPWAEPRALLLWNVFLVLAILRTTQATSFFYGADYYLNILLGSFIMLWLGTVIARDTANVRRLFQLISIFAALIAIHTIIEVSTGKFLFGSSPYDAYTMSISYFGPSGAGVHRAESFLLNADSNGAFFAIMLFIPLGLFIESSSFYLKILYLAEMLFMLPALLFTYSTGGWLGAFVGVIAFLAFVGRTRYRVQILLILLVTAIIVILGFPSQITLQLQHAANPNELFLRYGAWQTGIRVIQAFPFTGIGIGDNIYYLRSESYRVSAQYVPLYHPHNSYLELAALGGIPVLILFIALLLMTLYHAWRNWSLANVRIRPLLAGGIATIVALSANSMVNPGWTLAPLAAIGWLILGVISSPLLAKNLISRSGTTEK